jgi:hypothetical protein
MSGAYFQRVVGRSSNEVVELLTSRQHLRPHQPLREVLEAAMNELGCCPAAIARAVQWFQIDAQTAIGRLRRAELIQLGKSIQRFWQQAATEHTLHETGH